MYSVKIISTDEKDRMLSELGERWAFQDKADINGICIKLNTDSKEWREAWLENWYAIGESIHSHGRIFAANSRKEGGNSVKYDPLSKTAFLFNCDYYGNMKSLALAIAGDVLEDNHGIYSVHGACLEACGKGISIIGPSGSGKTTTTYGMMRNPQFRLVADDWHYVRFFGRMALAFSSEKNSYIRPDFAKTWKEYARLVKGAQEDNKGRALVDVRRLVGRERVKMNAELGAVVLLKRDRKDTALLRELSPGEALSFLEKEEWCNPHLLVRDRRKKRLRKEAFMRMLSGCRIFMHNAVCTPEQSQALLLEALL